MATSSSTVASVERAHGFQLKGLRWWIAALLMGVTIVNYLDRTCLAVSGPVLKSHLSIDEREFSHIVMAFQITYLVMQPVAGRIIDWLNLRAGMALAIAWWSVAQMLTALAGGPASFAVFRGVLGVGEAANFPGAAKAVSQWFRPRERTVATGILNMGAGFGQMLAFPIVTFIITRYDWRVAFVVTGAVGIAWVCVWLLVYRPPEQHPWMTSAEREYVEEGQGELAIAEPPAAQGVWKTVLVDKNFWALAIARFLSEPAWQFFTYWIPLYLATERHMKMKDIGYFSWVPFLAGDLGCLFGGVLSPLFGKLGSSVMTSRKLAASTCALLMMFAVFIGHAPTAPWAIFFFCIAAFAHQAMSSTLLTLPADLFPKGAVATANGLSGAIGGFGGTLFTMIVGIVAMTLGYAPLFVAIAFFDAIGAAFLWALLREAKTEKNSAQSAPPSGAVS
jgi:MFS transporter, ACS family, hexuronate transporter